MAYPHTLGNSLRMYDQAVYRWLDDLKIDYGDISGTPRRQFGILRVLATPKRAFSSMENVLVRKGWLDPTNPGSGSGTTETTRKSYQRVPLPFCSIAVSAPQPDPLRDSVARFRGMNASITNLTSQQHEYPIPINISMQLDFWVKKKFTEIYIREWILSNLNRRGTFFNEFFLTVTPLDHENNAVWGNKLIPVIIDSIDDASDLEPSDSDRLLRTVVNITLKAWLFLPSIQVDNTKYFGVSTCRLNSLGDPEVEYSDIIYYKFNLFYDEGWQIVSSDEDELFEREDSTFLYTPGANPEEGMVSNSFPVDPTSYSFETELRGPASVTISVHDSEDYEIVSHTYEVIGTLSKHKFDFDALTQNAYYVKIKSNAKTLLKALKLKKK